MDLWQTGDDVSEGPDILTLAVSTEGRGIYFAEEASTEAFEQDSATLTRWLFEPVVTLEDVGRQLVRRDAEMVRERMAN
jgi:hypothetical protein